MKRQKVSYWTTLDCMYLITIYNRQLVSRRSQNYITQRIPRIVSWGQQKLVLDLKKSPLLTVSSESGSTGLEMWRRYSATFQLQHTPGSSQREAMSLYGHAECAHTAESTSRRLSGYTSTMSRVNLIYL